MIMTRGESLCKIANEDIKDKHVFHIGCGNGEITQEISKFARKITGIEWTAEDVNEAKQRTYHCETIIKQGNAAKHMHLMAEKINSEMLKLTFQTLFIFGLTGDPKIGICSGGLNTLSNASDNTPPLFFVGFLWTSIPEQLHIMTYPCRF